MSDYGRGPDGDAKSTGTPYWQGPGYGLLLNRSRSPFEQSFTDYVELPFETGLPRFKLGDALCEKVDTSVNLVETPVDLVETLVDLAETLVNLVKPLVGVRLELVETLVDPLFHPMQGRQRHRCQSNAYGEDANKN